MEDRNAGRVVISGSALGGPIVLLTTAVLFVAKVMGASFSWWWLAVPFAVGIGIPLALFVVLALFAFVAFLILAGAERRETRRKNRLHNKWRREAMKGNRGSDLRPPRR